MKRFFLFCTLFFYFSFLGITFTYPLVKYLDRGMPYSHATVEEERLVNLSQGDYIQLFYYMWLFKDALLGKTPLFRDPYQLNISQFGMQDHFNNQYIPLSFLYAPLAILFGDIAGYNLLVLLTFPLAGFGFYLLALNWTRSRWAALIGATIYVLYPYRVAHLLGGHPGGFTHFLIPWIIYFYVLGLQKKNWLWGLASGLCFFGLGMDEFHVAYYLPLFLGIFLIIPFFTLVRTSHEVQSFQETGGSALIKERALVPYFLGVGFLGIIFGFFLSWWMIRRFESFWVWSLVPLGVIFVLGLWLIYSAVLSRWTSLKFSQVLREDALSYVPFILFLIYVVHFSYEVPGLGSYLIGFAFGGVVLIKLYHFWKFREKIYDRWGFKVEWMRDRWKPFVAFILPAFALFSWLLFEKMTKLDESVISEGRPLNIIRIYSPGLEDLWTRFQYNSEKLVYPGVFAVLLALIGLFMYRSKAVGSHSALQKWIFASTGLLFLLTYTLSFGPNLSSVPLYIFFHSTVPHFDYIRVPTRILYLSFFFLSTLCAFGFRALIQWMGRKSWIIAIAFLLGIFVDYLPAKPPGISLMPNQHPLYEYVKQHLKSEERILEIPIWPGESAWSSIYQFYATRYRIPMINGYRPAISMAYVEKVFLPLSRINSGEMNLEIWNMLKDWNVRFVLVHEEAFPGKVSAFPPHFTTLRLKESEFLEFIHRQDKIYLFEVLDKPDLTAVQSPDVSSGESFSAVLDRRPGGDPIPKGLSKHEDRPLTKGDFKKASPVHALFEGEHLKRRLGEEVFLDGVSYNSAVYVRPESGEGGWLFGKSRGLPKGDYIASFRIQGNFYAKKTKVLELEIFDAIRGQVLARRSLGTKDFTNEPLSKGASFQEFSLPFEIKDFAEAQPRIFYFGAGEVWLDRVSIGFRNEPNVLEAEELFHNGEIVDDSEASGREAVQAKKGSASRDIVFGPYRLYPRGHYTASFKMKVLGQKERPSNVSVATVFVSSNYGKKILSQKRIRLKHFDLEGQYQPFKLDFSLEQDSDLEFAVRFEGEVDLWVDKIEVQS